MELKPPVANVVGLVLLGILTLAIIYAGYVHGHMNLPAVYHSITNFT